MDTILMRRLTLPSSSYPSAVDMQRITASVLASRCKTHVPESLQEQAIDCILVEQQKATPFEYPQAQFLNLPAAAVEELMSSVASSEDLDKTQKERLLMRLPNEHLTELCFMRFASRKSMLQTPVDTSLPHPHTELFKRALQSCPRVEKVSFEYFDMDIGAEELAGWMAASWPNLVSVTLTNTYFLKNPPMAKDKFVPCRTIKAICTNLPKLCALDIEMNWREQFDTEEVEVLSQMQHLKSMRLHFSKIEEDERKMVRCMVQAVGRIGALERFHLDLDDPFTEAYSWFLSQYISQYPRKKQTKKLVLVYFSIDLGLKKLWPQNLSVEVLNVHRTQKVVNFDLSLVPAESIKKLKLFFLSVSNARLVVDSLGSHATKVTIHLIESERNKLDLHALLTACPKLKSFKLHFNSDIEPVAGKLPDGYFNDFTRFKLVSKEFMLRSPELTKVYQKYFLESRSMLEILSVSSDSELKAVVLALKQNSPTCLDQLHELWLTDVPQKINRPELTDAIGMLTERSGFFERVFLKDGDESYRPPRWFCNVMAAAGVDLVNQAQISILHTEPAIPERPRRGGSHGSRQRNRNQPSRERFSHDSFFSTTQNDDGSEQFDDIQSYLAWKDDFC